MNLQWLEDHMLNGERVELRKVDDNLVVTIVDDRGSVEIVKEYSKNHIESMARVVQLDNQIKSRMTRK